MKILPVPLPFRFHIFHHLSEIKLKPLFELKKKNLSFFFMPCVNTKYYCYCIKKNWNKRKRKVYKVNDTEISQTEKSTKLVNGWNGSVFRNRDTESFRIERFNFSNFLSQQILKSFLHARFVSRGFTWLVKWNQRTTFRSNSIFQSNIRWYF